MRLKWTNQLFTCAAAACLTGLGAHTVRADDVLRHVQQELRDQGFYYGTIDGSPGDETTQAIRRYQIRNGLAVSGQLDDATRKSIERTESSVSKTSTAAKNHPTASSDEDRQYIDSTPPPLNRNAGGNDDSAAPILRVAPHPAPETDTQDDAQPRPTGPVNRRPDLRVQSPDGAVPPGAVEPSPALTGMFAGTPFEFAPPPVQADVLRRAQGALLRDGFYDGAADGVPGPRTSEALSNLQQVSHVRATGRLDMQTLAILRLLPRGEPGPHRYYGPGPIPGPGGVYEGRIVQ